MTPDDSTRSKLSDEEFLGLVASERRQSIGFEHDNVLLQEREQALNYYKGVMDDMPHLPNRSGAVSHDVADQIETVLPDLLEVFVGGDDVVTFRPVSANDEQAAEQETEYVRQVVMGENDGFGVLYSMFKDALQSKVGVVKVWWEEKAIEPEFFQGKTAMELLLMQQDGRLEGVEQDGVDEQGQPTYRFTLTDEEPGGQVRIMAVPPEDFTVAKDAVSLRNATYCAFRTRPRKQDLIEQGVDADVVDNLPPYGQTADELLQLARDQAGEHAEWFNIVGEHGLGTVEVVEHYIKVDADKDGYPERWRILTGGNETVLIEKERVDAIPFAAVTPFVITHRFYGESLADRLIQIQRLKTAALRAWMDSLYFANNQRYEVDISKASEWTITDLLRLEPGLPVRVKQGGAVTPLQSGGLDFDMPSALEYIATMGEQRTGVVRNAQGLNPDTLHDTATGAMELMAAAMKRVRLIARIFAETGVKDLFLLVHGLLRKHGHRVEAKITGQWAPVDCSKWAERSQMDIQVAVGSAGKAQELAAMQQVLTIQREILQLQGGANGPIVNLGDIYAAIKRLGQVAGLKQIASYFSDPSQQPPQPPQPHPDAVKAQTDAQTRMAEIQARQQTEQAKLAQQAQEHKDRLALDYAAEHDKDQRERLKLQMEHEREVMKLQADVQIKQAELAVKRQDVTGDQQMQAAKLAQGIQVAEISAGVSLTDTQAKAQAEAARAAVDLEMQARDHAHDAEQAEHDRAAQIEAAAAAPKPTGGE